ncbi:MAG: hypothetical protein H6Q71_1722 [Firmicutes bacterium]|nr:hypothetical protein [Bacillota bacterium]
MNNDEARQYFKDKGLTYSVLNTQTVKLLKNLVQKEIDKLKNEKNDCCLISINRLRPVNSQLSNGWVELTVKGDYFDNREAITFNRDGFIGFAGWASTKNCQPFIDGFIKWCDEVKGSVEDGKGTQIQENY